MIGGGKEAYGSHGLYMLFVKKDIEFVVVGQI